MDKTYPELAEAILKGCEGTYQTTGRYHDYKGGHCAIGAALFAKGMSAHAVNVFHTIPELNETVGVSGCALYLEIVERNDHLGWTREEIALWLKTGLEKLNST